MRAPAFWQEDGILPRLLNPLGTLYGQATARRLRRAGVRAAQPVICCGNATAGGTGKTPLALAIADILIGQGHHPAFLTRGYGGRLQGPLQVDPGRHTARDVGDEPLLLAARAPTYLARNRAAAAALAQTATHLIQDDGLQSPDLIKDLSLLVIDGGSGFGNRRLIPAGPLREPITAAASRASAAILIGPDQTSALMHLPASLPVLAASLTASAAVPPTPLVAFAGIGRPEKFRATLLEAGGQIAAFHPFPDHHFYTSEELISLRVQATALNAQLITTEKDFIRLAPRERGGLITLPITLRFIPEQALHDLVMEAL